MDKAALQKLAASGMTIRSMAGALGCSYTNVRYWLGRYGIKSRHGVGNPAWQKEQENEEYIVSRKYDGQRRRLYKHDCAWCGSAFHVPRHVRARRHYCGRECLLLAKAAKMIEFVCSVCKKPCVRKGVQARSSKSGMLFCGRKCKDKAQTFEAGKVILQRKGHRGGIQCYRRIARQCLDMRKCARCGWKECIGVLRVHHRDRNRENNKPENLEVLCPTCHEVEHFTAGDGIYSSHTKSLGDGAAWRGRLTCNE